MKTEYEELIEKYPGISTHGLGIQVDPRSGLTYEEQFENERRALLRWYQEFLFARRWMEAQGTLRPRRAACFWKVDIANAYGNRVPDGIVILAAASLGYRIHRIRGSLGARIGDKTMDGWNERTLRRRPGKLTVIRNAGWACPMLVAMRWICNVGRSRYG